MSTHKLTPFFPANQPPVRPGVYKVLTKEGAAHLVWSYFSGGVWHGVASTPEIADTWGRSWGETTHIVEKWQGVLKD